MTFLPAILATVFFSAVVRTFTGFGFAMAVIPVFALYLSPVNAVVLSTLLVFAISTIRIKSFAGKTPLKPMLPLILTALLGTMAGTWLLTITSVEQFRLWAGISVITACLVLSVYRPRARSQSTLSGAVGGMISGLMNGLLAMPGPAIIVYTLWTEPDPRLSRIKLMTLLFGAATLALACYAVAGFITLQVLVSFVAALPALYLGDKLGNILFEAYGQRFYRRVALGLLFAAGAGSVISGLPA